MGEAMETVEEYRVKITVRNNLILRAVEDFGYTNLGQFAKCEGMSLSGLYDLINLKKAPIGVEGEFCKAAKELMEVLGACPTDLWTEEQLTLSLKSNSEERQLSKESLRVALQSTAHSLIGLPDKTVERKEAEVVIKDMLDTLPRRRAKVLALRFGIGGGEEHTLEETAEVFGCTRENIRRIESQALRNMRHPTRSDTLKSLMDDE
jgi:RNA polymerase sigma factor (sigma-70 family)